MDLTHLNNTSIELVRAVDGQNIRHAVLDFDGTLSLIRDGWQNVMVPMMVEILAQTPTIETEQQLEAIVVEFVDRLTGKQTIYQMMQLVKEVEIPSGHDSNKYIVERIKAKSHDGRMIPITLVKKKETKQDGKAKLILYAYGAYKHSVDPTFSAARFCLVDRGIIFAIAHVRGGGDLGDAWHEEAKKKLKKNTFIDYISCANYLI